MDRSDVTSKGPKKNKTKNSTKQGLSKVTFSISM